MVDGDRGEEKFIGKRRIWETIMCISQELEQNNEGNSKVLNILEDLEHLHTLLCSGKKERDYAANGRGEEKE